MAWDGYLEMGGDEILNSARVYGYASTSACGISWLKCRPCDGLAEAVGDSPEAYTYAQIAEAPWYDPGDESSGGFFGAYPISFQGLNDSPREAPVVQKLGDGGVIGEVRRAARVIIVRALLLADDWDSLEYGLAWLSAALDPRFCGIHEGTCGSADICFFSDCPPTPDDFASEGQFQSTVDNLLRRVHGVVCTSGPTEVQRYARERTKAMVVEFVLTAGVPWVWADPVAIDSTTPTDWEIVESNPINLVMVPSATAPNPTPQIVARNYVVNPSLETGVTTGTDGTWAGAASILFGSSPAPYFTFARVNDPPHAYSGAWTSRARLLGTATEVAESGAELVTTYGPQAFVVAPPAGGAMSFGIYVRIVVTNVGGVVNPVRDDWAQYVRFEYLNASNVMLAERVVPVLAQDMLAGIFVKTTAFPVPAGATKIRASAHGSIIWRSGTGHATDASLYADALIVSVP